MIKKAFKTILILTLFVACFSHLQEETEVAKPLQVYPNSWPFTIIH